MGPLQLKTSSTPKKNDRRISVFEIPDDSVLASYLL
jgi:hypothetical protein